MIRLSTLLLALIIAVLLASGHAAAQGSAGASGSDTTAVTVLTGGTVATMDRANPIAEAVAFDASGQIIAVGATSDVMAEAGEKARLIDLSGALVLPGFQDVHVHAVEAGINESRCLLSEFGTIRQYRKQIKACAEDQSKSPWFIAAGVSMPDLLDQTERPADLLEDLIPDKPALVLDNLGHGAWANWQALEIVGFDQQEDQPQGGMIHRDGAGEPTGIVYENAQQALRNAALPPNERNMNANYDALKRSLPSFAANGITSVSDAGGYWMRGHHEAWAQLERDGLLTVRASNAFYVDPAMDLEAQVKKISALKAETRLVRFDQVKIYIDGIISQGTAKLNMPYTETVEVVGAGETGFEYFRRGELTEYARRFDAAGFSLHFHAVGDKAASLALDTIETVQGSNGDAGNQHRITHLFLVDVEDVPRFKQLGVTADVQVTPSSLAPETTAYYRRLLGSRADKTIPVSSLLASGANVTFSSDWDADELNPLVKIEAAVSRKGEGVPDVMTALEMMTINAAKLLRHDNTTGSIEPGKRADLVIINQNILTIPADQIDEAEITATVFDGQVVYDPNDLFR